MADAELPLQVILYYKYREVPDVPAEVEAHRSLCEELGLTGRVLIASEGVNGTLAGSDDAIAAYCRHMQDSPVFRMVPTDWKYSRAAEDPFPDLVIKNVREIVSTGGMVPPPRFEYSPTHLSPEDYHAKLLEHLNPETGEMNEDTVLLDVRAHYEFLIGRFKGSTDIGTQTFAEYIQWMDRHADELRQKRVMMYCTGGIRCEKASEFLLSRGVNEVYQLKGGIHKYLEAFPTGGLWEGKNFVFDKRVAMGPDDAEVAGNCFACQAPYDTILPSNVCTVCRDPLLACPECVERLHGEFHCAKHEYLSHCYFTDLSRFTVAELDQQMADIRVAMEPFAVGRKFKGRRKTARHQLDKLLARRNELLAGQAEVVPQGQHLCRTCMESGCTGDCWGFSRAADKPLHSAALSQQAVAVA